MYNDPWMVINMNMNMNIHIESSKSASCCIITAYIYIKLLFGRFVVSMVKTNIPRIYINTEMSSSSDWSVKV
jgi:hypothetical protein